MPGLVWARFRSLFYTQNISFFFFFSNRKLQNGVRLLFQHWEHFHWFQWAQELSLTLLPTKISACFLIQLRLVQMQVNHRLGVYLNLLHILAMSVSESQHVQLTLKQLGELKTLKVMHLLYFSYLFKEEMHYVSQVPTSPTGKRAPGDWPEEYHSQCQITSRESTLTFFLQCLEW